MQILTFGIWLVGQHCDIQTALARIMRRAQPQEGDLALNGLAVKPVRRSAARESIVGFGHW
jgi:hypothetical protein